MKIYKATEKGTLKFLGDKTEEELFPNKINIVEKHNNVSRVETIESGLIKTKYHFNKKGVLVKEEMEIVFD
jgi:hypothetical protein